MKTYAAGVAAATGSNLTPVTRKPVLITVRVILTYICQII